MKPLLSILLLLAVPAQAEPRRPLALSNDIAALRLAWSCPQPHDEERAGIARLLRTLEAQLASATGPQAAKERQSLAARPRRDPDGTNSRVCPTMLDEARRIALEEWGRQ